MSEPTLALENYNEDIEIDSGELNPYVIPHIISSEIGCMEVAKSLVVYLDVTYCNQTNAQFVHEEDVLKFEVKFVRANGTYLTNQEACRFLVPSIQIGFTDMTRTEYLMDMPPPLTISPDDPYIFNFFYTIPKTLIFLRELVLFVSYRYAVAVVQMEIRHKNSKNK